MVKDVRWLKEKVLELGRTYREFLEREDRDTYGNETLPYYNESFSYSKGKKDAFEQVEEMIDELEYADQLELPVLPKYVAEYIESKKEEGVTLFSALEDSHTEDIRVAQYLSDVTSEDSKRFNQNKFARAWLDGYAVEEKKYVVTDNSGDSVLCKVNGKIMTAGKVWAIGYEKERIIYELTEQEVKDYDERYIPFMITVDEVDSE